MALTDGRIGQLLDGKYRLVELLARGGMGVVYDARHEATGRRVAVKILRVELATSPHLVRRVVAEARLAVEAAHSNVVEVLDAGTDDEGLPYLVLERLFGHTLESILTRPVPLRATVQALVPVMNAVSALHRAGIVHRDIKPSNLFLSRDAHGRITPKLLDFGIAKALEATGSTLSGTALGTPAYMAPEQALGSRTLGPQTDVWAMGVTLARCLTARLPFDDTAASRTGDLRSGLDERDFPEVPLPIANVLTRALRFEPRERFASMSEFRQALLSSLEAVDASEKWPNESSVSYAESETELAASVAAVVPEPAHAEEARGGRRGRQVHLATRTFSQLQKPAERNRARAWAVRTALALSVSVIIVIALRAPSPPSSPTEDQAKPATTVAPHPASTTPPVAAEPAQPTLAALPVVLPSPPAKEVRRAPVAPVSRQDEHRTERREPAPQAPPENVRATEASEAGETVPEPPRVGANRAPIIE